MPTINELLRQGFRAFRRPHWGPEEWIHVSAARERGDNMTEISFCAHFADRDPKGDADVSQWDDWQGFPWEHTQVEAEDTGKPLDVLHSLARGVLAGALIGRMETAIKEDRVEETLAELQQKLGMPEELLASLRATAAERKVEMEQEKAAKDALKNTPPFAVGQEMRA